jgi:hypothetical protein
MKNNRLVISIFLLSILLLVTSGCAPLVDIKNREVGQIIPIYQARQFTQVDFNQPIPKPGYIYELLSRGNYTKYRVFVDSITTAELVVNNSNNLDYCYNLHGEVYNGELFIVEDYLPTRCK